MTYDQLEMLEMIVQKGSFKAAAEALNKSQPSLSVAIQKIESEFDISLFDRSEYRPQLTQQGRLFFERARHALESFRELEVVAKELNKKSYEAELTLVVDPLVHFSLISKLFELCQSESTTTELFIKTEVLSGAAEALIKKEAQFAIGPQIKKEYEIESYFLQKIELVPVLLKKYKNVQSSKSGLAELPQIIVLEKDVTVAQRQQVQSAIQGGRKIFVQDHSLKRKMIENGLGWGYLSREEAAQSAFLVINKKIARPITHDFFLMKNKYQPLGPVGQLVWQKLYSLI